MEESKTISAWDYLRLQGVAEEVVARAEGMAKEISAIMDPCPTCKENEASDSHTCPYKEEIHGDTETCRCCENCEGSCCDDI